MVLATRTRGLELVSATAPPDMMEGLIDVVQQLSLVRTVDEVVDIVRHAARRLTGADGASFVLRERDADEDICFYVDEDAIGPLWKGRRFPASICVSGWAMKNARSVVIEDVFSDSRVPVDAYSPTFVKSLVMVPIRRAAPIGAIGVYWATRHAASEGEVSVLQALADSTSVALESVALHAELAELLAIGRRKEELAALVAHDIKSPASALMLRAQVRLREEDIPEGERRAWQSVYRCAQNVTSLATNMMDLSRSEEGRFEVTCSSVDVDPILEEIDALMRPLADARDQRLETRTGAGCTVLADRAVLARVLVNLVDNALSHNPRGGTVRLEARPDGDGVLFEVSDQGSGIPAEHRERVFDKYVRLQNNEAPRAGRGLGLSFCRLAVDALGGRIWIEDHEPRGTRFCVRLPRQLVSA